MTRVSKRKLASRLRVNKGRKIFLLSHPDFEEWGNKIKKKTEDRGCEVLADFTTRNFKELMARVGTLPYCDCIVLVPGHGCEAVYTVKGEKYRSAPGIVWSSDAYTKKPTHRIIGNNLKNLIRELMNRTTHLHLCTCNQGCMLDMYDEFVSDARTETEYVISGWLHALTMSDWEVDKFIYNGCRVYGEHNHHKLRFMHKCPATVL